ncbi:hypothetical protein Q1695_011466 [Nippostrongylus brasiliensis]|nr:hypothetical protein Q1695_011466 [Nippostrongylus brasiliensis]
MFSPPEVVKAPDQNMVDKKSKPKRNSGETAIPKDPTNPCEYEKKAADEGIVLNPQIVKHMGNIDDLAQQKRDQMQRDVESIKSDKDKSVAQEKKQEKMKVRINEKNCVLFEINDAATLDDQQEGDDPLADVY